MILLFEGSSSESFLYPVKKIKDGLILVGQKSLFYILVYIWHGCGYMHKDQGYL